MGQGHPGEYSVAHSSVSSKNSPSVLLGLVERVSPPTVISQTNTAEKVRKWEMGEKNHYM